MIKFTHTIIFAMILNISSAQTLHGWNGSNFFDYYADYVGDWLVDGSGGYAMVIRYRADKEPGYPVTLDSVITLHNKFTDNANDLYVMYCANVDAATPIENITAINYLIAHDVNVIGVEMGNEMYNRQIYNFDFDTYKLAFEPIVNTIRANYPEMPITYCTAPRPKDAGILGGRNDHKKWNDGLSLYLDQFGNEFDEVTAHIYFNEHETPSTFGADTILNAKRAYDPNVFYQDLSDYYTTMVNECMDNVWLWDSTLAYLYRKYPGRNINITEYGIEDAGKLNNTIAYHAIVNYVRHNYTDHPYIKTMMEHNGPGNSSPGCIFPSGEYDFNPNAYKTLRRLKYYTWQMYNNNRGPILYQNSAITLPGTYKVYYYNITPVNQVLNMVIDTNTLTIKDITVNNIAGNSVYASSGACVFMGKGSVKNYEITGYGDYDADILEMPSFSYGYFTFTVSTKQICNVRCKKLGYLIFNWKQCKKCWQ